MMDWNDKEELIKALQENGWLLEYVPEELKKDKEVVMAAVSNNSRALNHAIKELQDDILDNGK